MNIFNQDNFTKAWNFASKAHQNQKMPRDNLPYLTHIGNVVMEIVAVANTIENIDLAISCAILHDTIEDTDVTYNDINLAFSKDVADGVLALTKDVNLLTKQEQMIDSLTRIKKQEKSIWTVKLADRITNLQKPPHYWNLDKKKAYWKEAKLILLYLKDSNNLLSNRLEKKIKRYELFLY